MEKDLKIEMKNEKEERIIFNPYPNLKIKYLSSEQQAPIPKIIAWYRHENFGHEYLKVSEEDKEKLKKLRDDSPKKPIAPSPKIIKEGLDPRKQNI